MPLRRWLGVANTVVMRFGFGCVVMLCLCDVVHVCTLARNLLAKP